MDNTTKKGDGAEAPRVQDGGAGDRSQSAHACKLAFARLGFDAGICNGSRCDGYLKNPCDIEFSVYDKEADIEYIETVEVWWRAEKIDFDNGGGWAPDVIDIRDEDRKEHDTSSEQIAAIYKLLREYIK